MLSQRLTIDVLEKSGGDLLARLGEGESRAVLFGVTSGGDKGIDTLYVNINNPVVTVRIVKPDNTFVITTAELISGPGEIQEFRFYIPEAATQVSGIGNYDIRIQEDGEENIVYSAQGLFICDDNMLSDEMIESVAEVNGLIFPDDFATTDNIEEIVREVAQELGYAEIDDEVTSASKTWSSDKIADEIAAVIDDNDESQDSTWSSDKIADEIADKTEINDNATALTSTWSSDKIADEIADKTEINDNATALTSTWSSDKIADEIADKTEINDNTTALTSTWSSDKIADEIASAGGGGSTHTYSTTEQEVGKWVFANETIYEKTYTGLSITPTGDTECTLYGLTLGFSAQYIIDLKAYGFGPQGLYRVAVVEYGVDGYNNVWIKVPSSSFNRSISTIVLQYTKY